MHIPFDLDRKYTVEQIAVDHLKKSTKTVYNLIKERKLKAYRIGKEFVITASQLNDFAGNQRLDDRSADWIDTDAPPEPEPEEIDIDKLTPAQLRRALVSPRDLGFEEAPRRRLPK